MGRYRERKPYHFGIDYFKAYMIQDRFKKSVLFSLSANSSMKVYDKETFIDFKPGMGSKKYAKYFEVIDKSTSVKLAFILLGKRDRIGAVERRDIIEVTGQGLILRNVEYYLKMLDVLGFYIDGFKRVDICVDICINTHYAIKNIFLPAVEKKTFLPYCEKGLYTGLDIGNRNPVKNTWKFIRVYDKILDTYGEKNKGFLYDYKDKGIIDLTRIELELRRDKCKHFHVEYLTDPSKLYDIFKYEVFGLNFQFFKFIHKEDINRVIGTHFIDVFKHDKAKNLTEGLTKSKMIEKKMRIIEYGGEFKNERERKQTISMFAAYCKKLLGNGFTKLDILDMLDTITYNYALSTIDKLVIKTKSRSKEALL